MNFNSKLDMIKRAAFDDELQKMAAMPQFKGMLNKMLGRSKGMAGKASSTVAAGATVQKAVAVAKPNMRDIESAAAQRDARSALFGRVFERQTPKLAY